MKLSKDQADQLLKKGLISDKTHQMLCGGGEVKGYADGGNVTPMEPAAPSFMDNLTNFNQPPVEQSTPPQAPAPVTEPQASQPPAAAESPGHEPSIADPVLALGKLIGSGAMAAVKSANSPYGAPAQDQTQTTPNPAPESPAPTPAPSGALAGDSQNQAQAAQNQYASDTLDKVKQGYDMQQDALVQGAAAGAKQAGAESAFLNKSYANLQAQQDATQVNNDRRENDAKNAMAALQRKIDDVSSSTVDPNRFYKNLTTGQKIGSAIGLILGGFGAANGHGNPAVDVITGAINRDIDAQKTDINNANVGINQQQGIFHDMMSEFGDERQAEAATRAAMIGNAQLGLQAQAAKYQSPQILAKAQMAYGQLEVAKQKELLDFQGSIMRSPQNMTADADTRKLLTGAAAMGVKPDEALAQYGEYQKIQQTNKNIDNVYKQLAQLQTFSKRVGSPLQTNSLIDQKNSEITAQVVDMAETKRLNPEAYKLEIHPFMIKYTDSPAVIAEKTAGLKRLVAQNAKPTPLITALGIAKPPISMSAPVRSK